MKKVFSLMILLISILGINIIKASSKEFSLIGKVIYLDPGHGGKDPGALYKDIHEADINLKITQKLEKLLGEAGAIVYMTRDGDYDLSLPGSSNKKRSDLSRRAKLINESNCDLYISIHLNAENTGLWRGAQVFYDDINSENIKIASIFQKEFQESLNTDREYKQINDRYLYRNVTRPGILAEVGFLTNASDRYLLLQESYQEKVATSLYNATINYFAS